jgi:MFS superfamily sulfate permease-like transporter
MTAGAEPPAGRTTGGGFPPRGLRSVNAAHLADLLAALSIAGLLIPEAVAYSQLAGLPPQSGVLALFAGLICYGLAGTSRYAIVSATSSSAAVLAAATVALGGGDAPQRIALATLLVSVTGIALLLAGLARFGAVSSLIARPVLRGYIFGLALVITLKQCPYLLGLHVSGTDFLPLLLELVRQAPLWNLASLTLGLGALLALFLLEGRRYLPGPLIVIAAAIAAASWLSAHGVALVGPIHIALTSLSITLPAGRQWLILIEYAVAMMFIVYAESWTSIRSYAYKHDEPIHPNRDLVALGLANVLSGLLHGTPVGAGYSATSANESAGAQSRRAGLYAAGVVLVAVVLLLSWIERIPQPVLAAVVIHAVSKSLRLTGFRPYFQWRRDRAVSVIALVGVLLLGVMNGLLAAIGFNIIILLRSLASPKLSVLGQVGEHDFVSRTRFPEATLLPHILIVRPEEPLFFANAEPLMALARQAVRAQPDARVLVLSLEESPDLDSTSIESVSELATWLSRRGIELRIARLKDRAHEVLLRASLPQLPPSALEYSSVDDAVRGLPPDSASRS